MLVCGASFAGLAVARELAGSGARVLMVDRYELGERQTSACAMPTAWMEALELMGSLRQSFEKMTVAHPFRQRALVASVVVLDVRLPRAVRAAAQPGDHLDVEFETATVIGARRPHAFTPTAAR